MTQQFCTLTFAFSIPIFSLSHNWDSWIYSTISSLALYCAEQSTLQQAYCIEFCTSYRWGTDRPLSGGLIGWSWGFKYCTHIHKWGRTTVGVWIWHSHFPGLTHGVSTAWSLLWLDWPGQIVHLLLSGEIGTGVSPGRGIRKKRIISIEEQSVI